MKLKDLLLTDKIPIFLSALLAGVSLTLNHLITKYTNVSAIEYSIESIGQIHLFTITNLSTDKLFRDFELEVVLSPSDSVEIESASFEFSHPYRSFENVITTQTKESAIFPIKYLDPKSQVILRVVCNKFKAQPKLILRDSKRANEPMIFLENSGLTWMIKNEVSLNLTFVGVLIVLIFFYFFLVYRLKS